MNLLVGHQSLAVPLESAPGCCDLLLIYNSLRSKVKKKKKSQESSCLASARVVKFHDVAFCHHIDPLGQPVLILTQIQFPLLWEMSFTKMQKNCSSCWLLCLHFLKQSKWRTILLIAAALIIMEMHFFPYVYMDQK